MVIKNYIDGYHFIYVIMSSDKTRTRRIKLKDLTERKLSKDACNLFT